MSRYRVFDDNDHVSVDNKATKNLRTRLLIVGRYLSSDILKSTIPYDHSGEAAGHGQFALLGRKFKYCKACECASQTKTSGRTKKPLQELSSNSTRGQRQRARPPQTIWGCSLFNLYFCLKRQCWDEHIA